MKSGMKRLSLVTLFLSLQTIGVSAFAYTLPAPPAKDSAAEKRDYRMLHDFQESRTPEQCEAAGRQSIPTVETFFGPQTGVLTEVEIQSISVAAGEILKKVFAVCDPFKDEYHRPRPYNVDLNIEPCVSRPGGSRAYPSSHAAAGIVLADYLAKKFPAKRDAILREGRQIGLNRILGGVHHPSDVEAGQELGREMIEQMNETE